MDRRQLLQRLCLAPLLAGTAMPRRSGARVFGDGFEPGLYAIGDLDWLGGFRVPDAAHGGIPGDSFHYCGDPVIAMGSAPGRLLMVGQDLGGTKEIRTAAELQIPALVASPQLADMAIASYAQPFANLLQGVPVLPQGWNSDRVVSGLYHDRQSGRLVVNVTRYYDTGDPPNPYTALVLPRGDALSQTSGKRGFFRMTGGARSSGWISPVPAEFQPALGCTHLFGNSDGFSILSRASIGPSAFAYDLSRISGGTPPADGAVLDAQPLIDFPITHPLTPEHLLSEPGQIWTVLSSAKYGFIVPGSRSYLAIGTSGGHAHGVGYGVPPWDPEGYSGFYPIDPTDVGNHFWAFRVDDMIAVRQGQLAPHALRPYAHGDWVLPFQGERYSGHLNPVAGGCLDPDTGRLYVSLAQADRSRGAVLPLVLGFALA